ncbi:prolyl oligopeptidase family serine peptidase [candidate division KSB1 bacterium]
MRRYIKIFLAVFICTSVFFLPEVFSKNSDRLQIEDIFNLEFVSDPQISPDGDKIIYVRQFSDIMTDKRHSNLWIIDFDGTEHRPLTSGKYNDRSPRWSPDGNQIIYVSNREGKSQIYKRWMDTGQTVVLSNLQNSPGGIEWSPDGKYILFTSLVPSKPRKIISLPKPPPDAKWAKPATVIDRLVYRWGNRGYLKGYNHLFVIPSEGGTHKKISNGDFNYSGQAVWTPDSKYIIMSVNRRDDFELEDRDTEIYEFSVEDGSIRALTDRRGPDNSPVISPDGKYIAYTGYDDRYQGFQLTKLYLMNRDGSNPHIVINDINRSVSNIKWSGDKNGLYFMYSDKGNTKLAFTSLNGSIQQLTGNLGGDGTAFGRGSYTISNNGNFAFVYTRPDIPSEMAVGTAGNKKIRVLTSINDDILKYKNLGKVEEIWYSSSLDGRKIHGWIMKPPDFDSSKKYPVILEIHGGPFTNYGDRFDIEKQLMAAGGYVVLYTNPRGSTSYGEEFANLIHHAYPGDDFYDLNSGVDAIINKGYVDKENLFVTGGSGGGILTCWMVGRTDRFRAAVTIYPVINWYSWVLTTDIHTVGVKYWFPGLPWDNVQHYEKRSLLSVVKNVVTPTMVICGEEDWRCPISESEQYYAALKLLGVESVFVRVPGEAHGIRKRPSHHMSKIQHIISWFDQHRK